MSCTHDCPKPPVFPKTIFNRPGLPRIGYRIGHYAEMREHMFDRLNKEPMLSSWTHRGPDDPGIALIESAAIAGDILTFYQQLYANELYLRTAEWRESVAELVRLLGYRLAPGLGGEGTFALAVKGDKPVTMPKGFGLKAQIEGQEKPAEFESVREETAYPFLSQFTLYKPFQSLAPALTSAMSEFVLTRADGGKPDIQLKKGDRLLIGAAEPAGDPKRLANAEIVIVAGTHEEFGALVVEIEGRIKRNAGVSSVTAYVLGESYRHFGHNAPPVYFSISGTTTTAKETWYFRDDWEGDQNSFFYTMDFSVRQEEMPLDREVENVGAGNTVILQAVIATLHSGWVNLPYTLAGRVASVANRTFTFASVTGPSTVLTLEENLLTLLGDHPTYDAFRMDLRTLNFHLAEGEALRLKAKEAYVVAASGTELAYYGTAGEVSALEDRRVMFAFAGGASQIVQATGLGAGALSEPDEARHRRVVFDTVFDYSRFLHLDPQATVYGNLIAATQGKTEAEAAIGSGDQRRVFQTFALPKAPLTYLLDETQTPAHAAELSVRVDGIEWKRVESFFNAGPGDAVYIAREDEEGKSYVQFGDGKTGRLLPSGRGNVTAVYRAGQGAHGELKEGTSPQATGKLAGFDKLFLPAPVTGGSGPEEAENARIAAPGRMQSLGRMVSLADIEAEALAIPHVIKARAVWSAPEGVPLVRLTVLTESGSAADAQAVAETMRTFNRCRGPARFPIDVIQGIRQYVYVNIEAGFEAARREADVIAAIKQAIGLTGEEGNGIEGSDGFFGLKRRTFGHGAHPSQVIGAAQNAAGVTWVKLKAAQAIDLGGSPETDPAALAKPGVDIVSAALACPEERLLALHSAHFTLSLSKDEVARECEA